MVGDGPNDMTCGIDIKAYALGEASPTERRAAEAHIAGCAACSTEFESLNMVRAALLTDHDQEAPGQSTPCQHRTGDQLAYEAATRILPRSGACGGDTL